MDIIANLPKEGQPYIRTFEKCIRRSSDSKRTVVAINTSAEDRHGTIINPEGGDLSAYRNNPVFLINHDYGLLAGNGANVRLQNGQVIAEVDDSNWDLDDPEIAKFYNKVKKGFMRMASIGIIPKKIVWEEDENGERGTPKIEEWELLEWSFVTVGSNPEALVQARDASIKNKDLKNEVAELRLLVEQLLERNSEEEVTETPKDDVQEAQEEERTSEEVLSYIPPRKKPISAQRLVELTEQSIQRKLGRA
ncbi:MAG: HK97 family phage prohead protease [Balneola sp.]